MILCLVTDRRRLGAALRLGAGEWADAVRAQVFAAAAAGIDWVQLREPDMAAADLLRLTKAVVADTRHTATRIVVNDRLDVALAAGAAGVHLKERSFSVESSRAITPPGFLVGRSVHELAIQGVANTADYLVAGTVLPTVSKPAVTCLGWEGLSAIVRAASGKPVLAISGSTCHRFLSWQLVAQLVSRPSAPLSRRLDRACPSLCRNESSTCDWGLTQRIPFPKISALPP